MSKKLTTFLLLLVLSIITSQVIAQTTNGIFFQAVARDNFSNPAKDRKIYVQSSIIQATPTGTKVLTEEHQANTDATGVFNISLGNGVRVGGTSTSLTSIDWSKGPFYLNLKVAITPIGGSSSWDYTKEWVDMGTTSFGAVPFALYSASSAKVDDKLNVTDTTKMLAVYAKAMSVKTLETAVASKLTAADTLTMLAPYAKAAYTIDSSFFKTQLATKLSLADSTKYVTPTQLAAKTFDQTPITNSIATKLNIIDTITLSNRINAKANTSDVATKLSLADSTKYVTPTQLAAKTFDTTSLSNRINLKVDLSDLTTKLSIADSTKYVTPMQLAAKTIDTTSLSNRINLKANASDITALNTNITSNTASITANATAINLKAPIASPLFTGTVAIGTTNPSSAAALDITSTSQGLLLPRLSYVQKLAINAPVAGLVIWCSDCGTSGEMQVYNGTTFVNMIGNASQFALPVISSTTGAYSITTSAAISGGLISSDGGASITSRGIVWGTSTNPTISLTTKTTDGTGVGTFTSSITGLTSGVTYYLRVYATNSVGTSYGPEISLNTAQAVATLAATTPVSAIGSTTATSGGNITYNGGAIVSVSGIVWSTTSTPTTALATKTTDGAATGTYTNSITGLTPGTLYYVRSYATNTVGTSYGAQTSFTTLNTATISATASAISITSSTATTGGTITADGGTAVTSRGVVYGTSAGSATYSVTSGTGTGTYTSSLTGLTPATTYFVRSFATNSVGTVYGTETSFTTIAIAPTLTTTAASSITKYAASAGGTISSNGGSTITASGICWSTTATPTTSDFKTTDGTTSGTFTSSITGLTAGTTYYVRAYATNAIGTGYGAAQSFTTTSASIMSLPTVGSSYGGGKVAYVYQSGDPGYSSSNIPVLIAANADQVGNLSGGTALWSITGASGIAQQVGLIGSTYEALGAGLSNTNAIISAYGTGNYAAKFARDYTDGTYNDWYLPSINELGKLYLNRVAIGGFATQYYWSSTEVQETPTQISGYSWSFNGAGNNKHMDTKAWNMKIRAVRTVTLSPNSNPELASTTSATSITANTAILGGNVTDEGATQVSVRGLVYGTSTGSSTFSVTVGSGAGTFTSSLTGLAKGTTYYVRSFATNVQGTSYGAETSFTTQTTPTVSVTGTPTSITTTSTISGGTISSTGGATITTSGLVWDANVNPTISLSTKTTDGTTSGTFTSSITGLTQGATYHVRAYATNSIGTSYGPDITFTTLTTPTVSATATITSITGTTATGGGTISSDGGATVTTRGVVWGTISGSSTYSATTGTGAGTYVSNLSGLSIATTYYVRAFATNSVGTSYGPEITFTTLNIPTISSTTDVSSITGSSAISGGTITSDGGAAVLSRGIVWGTSAGSSTYSVTTGSGTGTFSSSLTGLARSTNYFVRAYATNIAGTVYGPEINFTTIGVEAPVLANTKAASRIGPNTASVGATITSDGGGSIISSGVCWNTTGTPTIADSKTSDGSGATFSSSIAGLSENTTYYVRSYATNSAGTSYGTQISFSTYGTVTTRTGKIWLDRNLGASRVAQSATDAQAYGDYFEWGRPADGHEKMQISGTSADFTSVKSSTSVPTNSKFIKSTDGSNDWLVTADNTLWTGANPANNPCPVGFRIPTESEFESERVQFTSQNANGTFEANYGLRLTLSGVANTSTFASNAWQISPGNFGQYLTQTAYDNGRVRYFGVTSGSAWFDTNYYKIHGQSVRCIKNY